jgi:hypothetical protein
MRLSLGRAAALLVVTVALTASGQAFAQSAGNKVYGTRITEGKFEIGYKGGLDTDSRSQLDMKHKHKVSVGYGLTDYWWTELIGELERGGRDTDTFLYEATEWENRFELITETDYLPGFGLYAALVMAEKDGKAHKIEARALVEKRIGAMRHRFNLNFERETGGGRDHGLELGYAWQTKWYVLPELAEDISLQPGFEAYGDFGPMNDFLSGADQKHQLGPVALAEFGLGQFGKFEFQVGTMFGVTRAAPDITLKWMLEYVVQF